MEAITPISFRNKLHRILVWVQQPVVSHSYTLRLVFILSTLISLSAPFSLSANETPTDLKEAGSYTIYLTNKVINGQPDTKPAEVFDCSDRIHLVVEGHNLTPERHELTVKWHNPIGDQQELTRFKFAGAVMTRTWAWLQLHGSTAASVGQIFDPSFGMQKYLSTKN